MDDSRQDPPENGDDEHGPDAGGSDGASRRAGDLLRKALTVGIGAAFLTEESIRGLVKEMKLPKEMIGGLLSTASETKNQFLSKLSEDVIARVSERVDPVALATEFLQRNEVEFTVKIKVSRKPEKNGKSEKKETEE